jgi:glycine betaine/proline transport system permease protein
MALYPICKKVMLPLLDVMQTMPAYVYLIPVIPFFGLGAVTAIVATMIFALPPVIRLTSLGIDQVSKEFLEAADAFGSSKWQKLVKVQLPLASKTILNGVNQGIMMSLSMVVLASLVGAKGLGSIVWRAIQRLDMGMGFEAGLAVVILAILLDRITREMAVRKRAYVE